MSITVITPTNRKSNIKIILDNFSRQEFNEKELIVLLNYDSPDLFRWKNIINEHENISVFLMGNRISLGMSLNFGVSKSKYDIIAKFDDDDYYSSSYLENSYNNLINKNCDIVGKTSYYIYFKKEGLMGLKLSNNENRFCRRVAGSTLLFKKELFRNIQFKDKTLGEDVDFCKDALKFGYKIYSTDRNDYIYFRGNNYSHTWKINNDYLINNVKLNYNTKPMSFLLW